MSVISPSLSSLPGAAQFFWNPSRASGLIAQDDTGRHAGRFRNVDPLAFWISKEGFNCGKFDGSNDIGEFQWRSAGYSSIPFYGQWGTTISVWLWDDTFATSTLIGQSSIWKASTTSTNFSGVGLTYSNSGYTSKWVHLALVGQGGVPGASAGQSWMYLNGVLVASGTTYIPTSTSSAANNYVCLGADTVAGVSQTNLFSGHLGEVATWPFPMSREAIAAIWGLGPNGLHLAQARRRAVYGVSSTAYTLTAESGTLSLAGSAATMAVARALAAASGTLNLTGSAATATVNRSLSAESGTLNLIGNAASLSVERSLSAESGTLNLVGSAADLTSSFALSAESGTLNLTGSEATLETSFSMNAESGTLNLTGSDATLSVGRVISAESGTLSLIGSAATITFTGNMRASYGVLSLIGSDATFTSVLSFPAGSGTLNLVGSSAQLIVLEAAPESDEVPPEIGRMPLAERSFTSAFPLVRHDTGQLAVSVLPVVQPAAIVAEDLPTELATVILVAAPPFSAGGDTATPLTPRTEPNAEPFPRPPVAD